MDIDGTHGARLGNRNMMCESGENIAWQSLPLAPNGSPDTKKEFRWGDKEPEWKRGENW